MFELPIVEMSTFTFFVDPSAKVLSCKNLDQSGNKSAVSTTIASQKCKNGGDSLGRFNMHLRTSPAAIDYMCASEILLVLELGGYDSCRVVQMVFGQCRT